MGKATSSDPYVELSVKDPSATFQSKFKTQKTRVKEKTLSPSYGEAFTFPKVRSASYELSVVVKDYDGLLGISDFMGLVCIPLQELAGRPETTEWYALKDKQGMTSDTPRGEIELSIHWRHNPAIKGESGDMATVGDGVVEAREQDVDVDGGAETKGNMIGLDDPRAQPLPEVGVELGAALTPPQIPT